MDTRTHTPLGVRPIATLAAVAAALALAGCDAGTQAPASGGPPPETAGNALDDAVITARVKAAISTDAEAHGAGTSVQTRKAQVLLGGFVATAAQKQRQEQLARAVEGVQSVDDRLVVAPGTQTAGNVLDDGVVTVKVKAALMADAGTRADDIAVNTHQGTVQLSGFVDSSGDRDRAAEVARNVEGVQNVIDATRVKQ